MNIPQEITYEKPHAILRLVYEQQHFELPAEYLRVFSPSAEVRGHHPDQAVLVLNKQHVNIVEIKPVGQYAVKLVFDDGHDTGLYSWDWLWNLAINHQQNWQDYLQKAAQHKSQNKIKHISLH